MLITGKAIAIGSLAIEVAGEVAAFGSGYAIGTSGYCAAACANSSCSTYPGL
jgi:hypothetical protein